jgi:excinuclease ABC subunit A
MPTACSADEAASVGTATKSRKKARATKTAPPPQSLLRSHTGEALIPMLETAKYEDRETYDASELATTQDGDLDLEQIGRDTLLPWQADGKRWHTRDSVDRKGEPIRWDRELLIKITDAIEADGGFSPISWENRSIVEVSGPVKSKGWFLHAITAETWLLKLKVRVPRRAFTKNQLESVANMPTLNQMENIEQYGNEPRVRARAAGAWMELELRPHTLSELDSPKFWKWFGEAMGAFLGKTPTDSVPEESAEPEKHMPWKVLKQRWHSLRKGFPPGRAIAWPAETLSVFIQSVHQTSGEGRWRWDEQTHARYYLPGQDEPWITLHTKRPEALIAVLTGPPGFTPGNFKDSLPVPYQMTTRGETAEQLQISFTELQQPRDSSVKKLLAAHLEFFHSKTV